MNFLSTKLIEICKASLLLFSLAVMVSACGFLGNQSGAEVQNSESSGDSDESNQADPEVNFGKHALGIKNNIQIYESMQSVTGLVAENYGGIRNFYNDNKTSLPQSNDTKALSATQLLTIVNLAYEFCDEIVDNNTDQQTFFAGTGFTGLPRPSEGLATEQQKLELVRHLLDRFWGLPLEGSASREASELELISLIDTLIAGEADNSNTTARTIEAVCTAALSSSPVTFF